MLKREINDSPDLSKCSLPPSPIKYDSRSEYALCELFKRYIPGWTPIMGVTFQIPIIDKRIDFLIDNSLIEFHPIIITRELKSSNANSIFRQMFGRADKWERGQLVEMLVEELSAQYSHRRWQLIQHSEHRGKSLIVCGNVRQVYKRVIERFAKHPPRFKVFEKDFLNLVAGDKI